MQNKKKWLLWVLGIPIIGILALTVFLFEETFLGLVSYQNCDIKIDRGKWRLCLNKDIYEDSMGGYYTDVSLGKRIASSIFRHYGGGAGEGSRYSFGDTRSKELKLFFENDSAVVSINGTQYIFKVPDDFISPAPQ